MSGRPSNTFAFGGGGGGFQAQPRSPPQQQGTCNRFAALGGGGGRGGGRSAGGPCFACGQYGHLKADCPRSRAATAPAEPDLRLRDPADVRRAVSDDLREEWPAWPFTCYSPSRGGCNLVCGDASFEEVRAAWHALPASRDAQAHALQAAAASRCELRERLQRARSEELAGLVREAAEGRPWPGAQPELVFTAPTPGQQQAALPQQSFAQQPPSFPTPGVPQQSAFAVPSFAGPQQALACPPAVQQQQQPPAFAAFCPPPTPPMPQLGVAASPPAPAGAPQTDAECWSAPVFTLGRVPEAPPPGAYL